MPEKILCIDDDQNVLDGYQRQLRKNVMLTMRTSGEAGLKAIREEGPFAVVVSDMQMPEMDGISFLTRTREIAPDSVRIMLTGMADQQTAVNAVNEGNIFRFLTKPCPSEVLLKSIEAGIALHKLITAEQELLENTLKGSIKVLVDVLSLANPMAFSRTMRLRKYVTAIAAALGLKNDWQLDVAAMLSQLGCVTIPGETLEKFFAGESLTVIEKKMMSSYPETGRKLIANIPRLGVVAEIIAGQQEPFGVEKISDLAVDAVKTGSGILRVAMDFDVLHSRGTPRQVAVHAMMQTSDLYDRRIVETLNKIDLENGGRVSKVVKVRELRNGMILEEDIRSDKGVLVLPRGSELNDAIHQRLVNFLLQAVIRNEVRVSVPRGMVPSEN